jgi:single-stranded-DNA-specific exonuclease
VGIAALLDECGMGDKKLTASSIGFTLAPRLNAAGRLGQAATAARLLLASDAQTAAMLAAELCDLNRRRQSIETDIWADANQHALRQNAGRAHRACQRRTGIRASSASRPPALRSSIPCPQ